MVDARGLAPAPNDGSRASLPNPPIDTAVSWTDHSRHYPTTEAYPVVPDSRTLRLAACCLDSDGRTATGTAILDQQGFVDRRPAA